MITGLDTSRWEDSPADPRTIDWQMAKANGADFVIMKATEGTILKDAIFPTHKAALNGLLPRGSYHYLRTQSLPADQAKYYYDYAGKLELPPILDVEDYYLELPKGEALYTLIQKTLGYIDYFFGQRCMLYTSPNIIKYYLGEWAQKLTDRKLWIAHYGVKTPDFAPWSKYTIWQWTDTGDAHHYGITEANGVDMNIYPGTVDDFNNEFGIKQETNTMSIYSNYAHIPGVDKRHSVTSAANIPGLVITGYDGKNAQTPGGAVDPQCSAHIDAANKLGVPAFILFRILFDTTRNWVNLPAPKDDWNMQVLDKVVFQDDGHTIKRKINGIILDARGVQFSDGKWITPGNWVKVIQWFYDAAWKRYGIGLYLIMNQETIDKMPEDVDNAIQNCVSRLNSHACVSIAPLATGKVDSYGLSYPSDESKPTWLGNVKRVYMWYYNNECEVPGITGGNVDLWEYDKSVMDMENEIGFVPTTTPITPTPVTPTPITPAPVTPTPVSQNTNLSDLATLINQVIANQTKQGAELDRIGKHFSG